jgi:AcrR family transcriptional regulator
LAARQAKRKARAAKEELYRKLVLDAAERVFADKGYEAVRMGEIAEQSGISLQTLYSVFPGKVSIYDAIQETGDRELHELVIESARGVSDPFEALIAGLRATTRYFLENPDFLRIRLHGGFTWGAEASAAGDRGRTESWRAALEMLRVACRRCIDAGLFVDRDPGLLARMLVAMQQIELAHWLDGGMRSDIEQVMGDLEAQIGRAFRIGTGSPASARRRSV